MVLKAAFIFSVIDQNFFEKKQVNSVIMFEKVG